MSIKHRIKALELEHKVNMGKEPWLTFDIDYKPATEQQKSMDEAERLGKEYMFYNPREHHLSQLFKGPSTLAKVIERLKALETVNRNVYGMPLIMIDADQGLTNNQKHEIIKAEKEGINVVKITRDKSYE